MRQYRREENNGIIDIRLKAGKYCKSNELNDWLTSIAYVIIFSLFYNVIRCITKLFYYLKKYHNFQQN